MNWKEYTEGALKTATHKSVEIMAACSALGLNGEWQEYMEAIKIEHNKSNIIAELGDVTWYLAILSHISKVDPTVFLFEERPKYIGNAIPAIQEVTKKAIRDFSGDFSKIKPEKYALLREGLCSIYYRVELEVFDLGITVSDILVANNIKLASRQSRNVLHGEGDER